VVVCAQRRAWRRAVRVGRRHAGGRLAVGGGGAQRLPPRLQGVRVALGQWKNLRLLLRGKEQTLLPTAGRGGRLLLAHFKSEHFFWHNF
jgi:hypothetical protein